MLVVRVIVYSYKKYKIFKAFGNRFQMLFLCASHLDLLYLSHSQ